MYFVLGWIILWILFVDGRVYEIYTRDHFHDLLQDTPVNMRPNIIIAFYNDTIQCKSNLNNIQYSSDWLPDIRSLLITKYEISTYNQRIWWEYEPHSDLVTNIGLNEYINDTYLAKGESVPCPILVYIPYTYADEIEYNYTYNPSLNGIEFYNPNIDGNNWRYWVLSKMKVTLRVNCIYPFKFKLTVNHWEANYYHKNNPNFTHQSTYIIDGMLLDSNYTINIFIGDGITIKRINDNNNMECTGDTCIPDSMQYPIFPPAKVLTIIALDNDEYGFKELYDKRWELMDAYSLGMRHSTTMHTHTRNIIIPQILPNMNNGIGYIKLPMPPGLHEKLYNFYRKYYDKRTKENWDKHGTQLNFFDKTTYLIDIQMNYTLRNEIIYKDILPLITKWINDNNNNNIELQFTSFYGIREYPYGSSLRNHVDRVSTHVASVILQIGQTGIYYDNDNDWSLEVIGFNGKRNNIYLKPGEMIFYSGHTLIHGRPYGFKGELYANAFLHYKPKNIWDWVDSDKMWKWDNATKIYDILHTNFDEVLEPW